MPNWLNNAIFYEIYPQSFMDTNADGIGDIPGIIEKLDYIQALGCNALWLNPCFASPFGDAGYDVEDYYRVAPRYGTNADLKRLFEAVHARNMHILLDLVPGHTAITHPWFKASCKAKRNEFTDRYVWTDSAWKRAEGFESLRGISERDGAVVVNFFAHQPALNYGFYKQVESWQQSPDDEGPCATLNEMENVMRFWIGMGCDGFRVDMAGSLVKNDPYQLGTIALWKKVRAFLDKEFPEAVLISEWGQPDRSLQGGFHMDFLLHFGPSHYTDLFRCEEPFFSGRGKGNVAAFVKKYIESYEKSERRGLICIPSGNHDMDRLARWIHGDELKIAFAFLLSMPGAPFIYYGDEIGMRYVENIPSVEGGYNRTGSRSPMQWDHTTNAGFSAAAEKELYIPLDAQPDRPTVESQQADSDSLYHEIQKLIRIRQAHSALQSCGDIEFVYAEENAYPFAYLRSDGTEKILVIINPADCETRFAGTFANKETIYAFGQEAAFTGHEVIVPAQSAGFYRV